SNLLHYSLPILTIREDYTEDSSTRYGRKGNSRKSEGSGTLWQRRMRDDAQLLRAYAEGGDEAAFAELVNRYINLVWGAGYRVTGDADLARDVAQAAFTELARASKRLSGKASLSGWLYRVAYHNA